MGSICFEVKRMDPQRFYEKMADIRDQYKNDIEEKHFQMDNLMCETLRELGYNAGVTVFENTDLWYA